MQIMRSTIALVGQVGFGLLALGAMGQPARAGVPPVYSSFAAPAEEWSLALDEATLTRQANAWAAGQVLSQTPFGMVRLQDLGVQLRNDEATVHGSADAGWIRASIDLEAAAAVQQGRVIVQLRGAQVNGIQVPDVARREIEQQLQDQLDQSLATAQLSVRCVHIGDGQLSVTGTRG
jgi:hypothetical protein